MTNYNRQKKEINKIIVLKNEFLHKMISMILSEEFKVRQR